MKLKPLPPSDPVSRISVSLRSSVHAHLSLYAEFYEQNYKEPIDISVLITQMLKDYMAEDKGFQKALPELLKKAALNAQREKTSPPPLGTTPLTTDGTTNTVD